MRKGASDIAVLKHGPLDHSPYESNRVVCDIGNLFALCHTCTSRYSLGQLIVVVKSAFSSKDRLSYF